MKLKPSQRNALKSQIKTANAEIARHETALARFKPGSPPYKKVTALIAVAVGKKESAMRALNAGDEE